MNTPPTLPRQNGGKSSSTSEEVVGLILGLIVAGFIFYVMVSCFEALKDMAN